MASGDSANSCVSTSRSCGLLDESSALFKLQNLSSTHQINKALQSALEKYVFLRKLRATMIAVNSLDEQALRNNENDEQDSLMASANYENSESIPEAPRPPVQQVGVRMTQYIKKISNINGYIDDVNLYEFNPKNINFAVSIDRTSFRTAIQDKNSRKMLVCLLFAAKFVCFSGMMPKDKSDVIRLLKKSFKFKPVVLAVGDGNSDISMIQEADIGVGISGKEESQAKNYAEVTISDFSQLKKLLLIHGYWNYSRMSKVIILSLYKNFLMTLIIFGFFLASDYSGTSIFNGGLLVGFNIFFTVLPILSLGVFDERSSIDEINLKPNIYCKGIFNTHFNKQKCLLYIVLAFVQTGFILLLISSVNLYITNEDGNNSSLALLEFSLFICLVVTVLLQIFKETTIYDLFTFLSFVVSFGLMIGYLAITNHYDFTDMELNTASDALLSSPANLIAVIIIPLICMIPSLAYEYTYHLMISSSNDKFKIVPEDFQKFNRIDSFSKCLQNVFVANDIFKNDQETDGFQMNKYTMHFRLPHIEGQYRERYIAEHLKFFRKILAYIGILLVAMTIVQGASESSPNRSIAAAIITALELAFTAFSFSKYFEKNYIWLSFMFIAVCILIKFIVEMATQTAFILISAMITELSLFVFDVN